MSSKFAFTVLLYLQNARGIPSTRVFLSPTTLTFYILPPLICYLASAILAVTPHTGFLRAFVCPASTLLAFRAMVSIDMSLGRHKLTFLQLGMAICMIVIAFRSLHWIFAKEPLVRCSPSDRRSKSVILDALDLAANVRGIGWEWTDKIYIPQETRRTDRIAFVAHAFRSFAVLNILNHVFSRAILMLAAIGGESIPGGTFSVFDETLPFPIRHLRTFFVSMLVASIVYAMIQSCYDLLIILAVLVLGQSPAQWPPIFDAPWCFTSLSDFWGRKWHQLWRHIFLFTGGYQLSIILGRPGMVLGAFLSSGVVHYLLMNQLGGQVNFWNMLLGYGMIGVGVLAEWVFQRLTKRRVGGIVGKAWVLAWLYIWASLFFEEYTRTGSLNCCHFYDAVLWGDGMF